MKGCVIVDIVQRKHTFTIVGLIVLNLELTSFVRFPLCSDAVDQSTGLKIGGDCNGEVHDRVLEVLSCIIAMSLLLLALLPVFLLLKNSVPRGKCI